MTWTLPPVSLLTPCKSDAAEPPNLSLTVLSALTHRGVDVVEVKPLFAPQLVRYEVELAPGADPKKVEQAIDSVSLAVGAKARYAGVHGGRVGIEVNREDLAPVGLREMIERGKALTALGLPLGLDVQGHPRSISLAKMPHLFVAGTTGSGKSVWMTAALTALLLRNTPDDMRMVLIDPKRVDLAAFAGLPHLMGDIITETAHANLMLRDLIQTMERRFSLFEDARVKDLAEYNDLDVQRLPRIVVVIDELADLLMQSRLVEGNLVRLLQKGRAAGIHFILATQRPEAKVFGGLIRSNVPARIVFAVQSHVDSKVAMDQTGAEKLRGQGDGLFRAPSVGEPVRFQAPMVSSEDVDNVVTHWKRQAASAEAKEMREQGYGNVYAPHEDPRHAMNAAEEAERRALAEWRASEHADTSVTATISPDTILAEAGFTPVVIEALVEKMADKIAEAVAHRVNAMVLSEPDNGGE